MESDIRALLAEAATGAPTPRLATAAIRAGVRRRRAQTAIAAVTTVAIVGAAAYALAYRLGRNIDAVDKDCGGSWTVTTPSIPSSSTATGQSPRGVSLRSGIVAGASTYWFIADEYGAGKRVGLTVRYDGREWKRFEIPHVAGDDDGLSALAWADGDLWAGGYRSHYDPKTTKTSPTSVLLHWNGSAWDDVEAPPLPDSQIHALAVRADRIIVAGSSTLSRREGHAWYLVKETAFLAERKGGGPWRAIALPDLKGDYTIQQILIQKNGSVLLAYRGRGGVAALEQDDGEWRKITAPGKPIVGIDVVMPDDIWAWRPFFSQAGSFELLHYDGRTWRAQTINHPDIKILNFVGGGASGDAWVVASRYGPEPTRPRGGFGGGPRHPNQAMFLHWDGRRLNDAGVAFPGEYRRIGSLTIDKGGRGLAVGTGTTGSATTGNLVIFRC